MLQWMDAGARDVGVQVEVVVGVEETERLDEGALGRPRLEETRTACQPAERLAHGRPEPIPVQGAPGSRPPAGELMRMIAAHGWMDGMKIDGTPKRAILARPRTVRVPRRFLPASGPAV